ncbi:MAG TPA: cytochrome C [Woeseiaceae bacterium]|nr:cytochrome C [Woeseiaceae bacterium]
MRKTTLRPRVSRVAMVTIAMLSGALLAGCEAGPKSAAGFRLPDGDPEAGRAAFLALQCNSCHVISNYELPPPAAKGPVQVTLGGEVTRVKTYGELVTSIINPSHKLVRWYPEEEISEEGESLMPGFNDRMTVRQLINLVAFLQPHYDVVVPRYEYPEYQYAPIY